MQKNSRISIVVPTYNEQGNVRPLIERIHQTLSSTGFTYELIFIDDHSTDDTWANLRDLSREYPVSFYLKQGKKGKAQSLVQGFALCRYNLICMIDADLQYAPEYIPQLIWEMIEDDADIVIATRVEHKTSFLRRFVSAGFNKIFVKWLHGFNVDSQSGLKIFKKLVLNSYVPNAGGWAFDLDFLIQARHNGFKIGSSEIIFSTRFSGPEKVGLIKAAWEIGMSALELKVAGAPAVPFNRKEAKEKGQGFKFKGRELIHHTDLHSNETALKRFGGKQLLVLIAFGLVYIFALLINWHTTVLVTFALITFLYFADLLFNLYLIYRSFKKSPEIKISEQQIAAVASWPTYTIFCPLYKEWQVVPQFVTAMSQLDYPADKLQIMLLLEEDDRETIEKVAEFELPGNFEVVVVPHSLPKTKPKALNYGLSKARGEYIVIYDAEDVPDPMQLKKAVLGFKQAGPQTICVQAKLNFYNPHQNILTRVFAAEYSLWFDLVLPGMQSIEGPLPLGGTSNHFRRTDVVKLKGWDAFNVTEDCDLGIRLSKNGYKTAIIESTTLEEANSHFWNWFKQRSRWIKGYIQTYLVHMRRPSEFLDRNQHYHLAAFQFIVGGKIFSMFINPLMWCITIAYFAFRANVGGFIESFFPSVVLYVGVTSFIFGNFLYLYYYMIACAKRGYFDLIKYVFVVPFYWLMMSVASWIAVYEIIVKPHYWAKTLHGLHLNNAKGIKQSREVVGEDLINAGLSEDRLRVRSTLYKSED